MQNFQDTFETRKRSFISAFSICMTTFKRYFVLNPNVGVSVCERGNFPPVGFSLITQNW